MKKLLFIPILMATLLGFAQDSSPITVVVTSQTNIVQRVEPIRLTKEQMDGVIRLVQSSGISANAPITSDNLRSINVIPRVTSGETNFWVSIQLRPN